MARTTNAMHEFVGYDMFVLMAPVAHPFDYIPVFVRSLSLVTFKYVSGHLIRGHVFDGRSRPVRY